MQNKNTETLIYQRLRCFRKTQIMYLTESEGVYNPCPLSVFKISGTLQGRLNIFYFISTISIKLILLKPVPSSKYNICS